MPKQFQIEKWHDGYRHVERLIASCNYADTETQDEESTLKQACRLGIPPHLHSPYAEAETPASEVYAALVIEHLAKDGYAFAELYRAAQAMTIWKSLEKNPGPPEAYGALTQQRKHADQVIYTAQMAGIDIDGPAIRDQLAATMYSHKIDLFRQYHVPKLKAAQPQEQARDYIAEGEARYSGSGGRDFWS